MHPKDKIPAHLRQDVVHQWTCANDNCNILILENLADAWKAEPRNTVPHLQAQYSNIAQPQTTVKLMFPNLKSLTRRGRWFSERPKRPYI